MSLCFAEDVRGKPSTVVVVDFFSFFVPENVWNKWCACSSKKWENER